MLTLSAVKKANRKIRWRMEFHNFRGVHLHERDADYWQSNYLFTVSDLDDHFITQDDYYLFFLWEQLLLLSEEYLVMTQRVTVVLYLVSVGWIKGWFIQFFLALKHFSCAPNQMDTRPSMWSVKFLLKVQFDWTLPRWLLVGRYSFCLQ